MDRGKAAEAYLTPSGYTGDNSPYSGEEGSNGLFLSNDGKLVLCQHGDRKVSLMDAPLDAPTAKFLPTGRQLSG
jgi:gluconolactonase